MCGIIACDTVGPTAPYLAQALARLEYRGYDSVGLAVADEAGRVHTLRTIDRVADLQRRLSRWYAAGSSGPGIGHSRWATHGAVSERNAHPHADCSGRLTVVHNGIVENADELRTALVAQGHGFASDVDSEVIAHLVEQLGGRDCHDSLHAAVAAAVRQLRGSWAIVVLDGSTREVVAAAHHSPLVVAHSPIGDFIASDVAAIAPWIGDYRVLDDGDVVSLGSGAPWTHLGRPAEPPAPIACSVRADEVSAGTYPDFMAKEIDEQPDVTQRVLDAWGTTVADGRLWQSLELPPVTRVLVVGCGTSLHAGRAVGAALTGLGGLPHQSVVASEAGSIAVEPGTLVLALSQSGETADVLRALDGMADSGAPVLAITNNPHSALGRRADAVVTCHAGVEIGVAATKTFVAQVMTGSCVVVSLLAAQDRLTRPEAIRCAADLATIPDVLAHALGVARHHVPALAASTVDARGFIFLGRGSSLVYADEGALKLKELTYRWADSHPAGEIKHGPLALVERGTPVLVVEDGTGRLESSVAEVRARGAHVIRIGGADADIPTMTPGDAVLPSSPTWLGPVGSVVGLQVFARELALALGRDVDKPRNLAKSVTVQ